MPDLRYPIGQFQRPGPSTPAERDERRSHIAALPATLRAAVAGLDDAQLDTVYRDGGWTVRQVVHHLADSHLNALARFKLTLTESEPTIKAYEEARWAELADGRGGPIEPSLAMLDGLHARWVRLLESLGQSDYAKKLNHPEIGVLDLDFLLAMYAWHGRHHVAHITGLRERKGW